MFTLPVYHDPDFQQEQFRNAPDVRTAEAEKDGVVPEYFHSTSMFPEYFRIGGEWKLAEESRMDCCVVIREGKPFVVEQRNVRKGEAVVLGRSENGEEGIYMYPDGFASGAGEKADRFAFRTNRSRETAFTKNYQQLAQLLKYEKDHGHVLFVMGPACAFDRSARRAAASLIEKGYIHGLLAGNALATHDLEAAHLGTALGQDIDEQCPRPNGHYHHLEVINRVRRCGSIPAFIEQYDIHDGIIHACVKKGIPYVLTGSIRDDGPLPEVISNASEAQTAMREQLKKATTVICLATQLHTIASGNILPSYRVKDGVVRPVYFYAVDISEFVTNKLHDRGSLSAVTIVSNVQDFLNRLEKSVCGTIDDAAE